MAAALLRARGVGRVEGSLGWLWLRARAQSREGAHGRLLLDQCLLGEGGGGRRKWEKEIVVELQSEEVHEAVAFELWAGQSRSTDLLQFAAGWTVDLAQWIESGNMERWYPIAPSRGRHTGGSETKEVEYCQSKTELLGKAAYVYVSIARVKTPLDPPPSEMKEAKAANKSSFRFVLPRRPIARSSKLRAVRVGQIVHELRTDTLRDLLPLTLYGCTSTEHHRYPHPRAKDHEDGSGKALILLQLSCQYATYCVRELDRYVCKLKKRSTRCNEKASRLKHRQGLLKERKANLQREVEVVSCSLEGMQSLLHELDPGTLAQLKDTLNVKT